MTCLNTAAHFHVKRTPNAFDQIIRDRSPIASVKRVCAIAKEENFRIREGAASDPSLRCAGPIPHRRNLDAINAEHASASIRRRILG